MEYGVGSLVTPSHMAIDLRLFKDDMTEKINGKFRWFIPIPSVKSIGQNCAGERPLAMTPSKFDEKMDEKVTKDGVSLPKIEFTVEDDRDLIKGLYRKTFDGVIVVIMRMLTTKVVTHLLANVARTLFSSLNNR